MTGKRKLLKGCFKNMDQKKIYNMTPSKFSHMLSAARLIKECIILCALAADQPWLDE